MGRRLAAGAVAVVMMVAAGCTGEDRDDGPTVGQVINLYEQLHRTTEELIAACMRERGFEYQPVPVPPQLRQSFGGLEPGTSLYELPLSRLPTVEQARQRGFGIVDQVIEQASQPPRTDPNLAIQESLSDTMRTAWVLALDGGMEGSGGCRQQAAEQARAQLGELRRLESELSKVAAAIEADPRVAQAETEWVRCMARQGIATEGLEDLQRTLNAEVEAAIREPLARGEEPPSATIAELRQREIALAVPAAECLEPLRRNLAEVIDDARKSSL